MKILLLSVQFKTTKKRVLNWKKKFSQKLIFLNFNILKVQNITYVNGKCQNRQVCDFYDVFLLSS